MLSEQERLDKAKAKLMNMNKRVQNAQNLSKKRVVRQLEPLDPPKPANPPASTYIFELTESLIADGFSEELVSQYVGQVESEAKQTDLDLDQRELVLQAELKRINRMIARIRDPKPPPAEPASKEPPAPMDPTPESSPPSGYAGMRQARQNPMSPPKKVTVVTPKKPEREKKKMKEVVPEEGAIKATGAGAKFLADLMDDDQDPPF
jgi:hypothetical protein